MKDMNNWDDILEKSIRENKALWEEDAPEGHFERFEQRLSQQQVRPLRNRRKLILQIAAAVAFALLLGNQVRLYLQPQPVQLTLGSISPEYAEAEFYYTSAINQGMNHWEKLSADGLISEDEQQLMQQEITEFETTYKKLQEELSAAPDDERVIHAMLELYNTRLSIINLIIEKLEEIKTQKDKNHDETKI